MAESVECKTCSGECQQIGTLWYCPNLECEQYATPRFETHHGTAYTREEWESACEADDNDRMERYAERRMNGEPV